MILAALEFLSLASFVSAVLLWGYLLSDILQ